MQAVVDSLQASDGAPAMEDKGVAPARILAMSDDLVTTKYGPFLQTFAASKATDPDNRSVSACCKLSPTDLSFTQELHSKGPPNLAPASKTLYSTRVRYLSPFYSWVGWAVDRYAPGAACASIPEDGQIHPAETEVLGHNWCSSGRAFRGAQEEPGPARSRILPLDSGLGRINTYSPR